MMKLYIRQNKVYLHGVCGYTEVIEVEELPQRPTLAWEEQQIKSVVLIYKDGVLAYEISVDRFKVRNLIDRLKSEMNSKAYKTEKQVQGLLSAEEWDEHRHWCAEKRAEINELEQLIKES